MISCLSLSFISVSAEETVVYKNPNASLVLDGQTLHFTDNGKNLDLLMLDGTAYVPLMQFSKALGKEITWSQIDQAFYIGIQPGGVDMIEILQPYSSSNVRIRTEQDNYSVNIANKEYTKYIYPSNEGKVYYNLEGKYSTITFKTYSDHDSTDKFCVYGDNDALLYKTEIKSKNLPVEHTVDVRNVFQLTINTGTWGIFIFDIYAHP
jgi:hypothetical protein